MKRLNKYISQVKTLHSLNEFIQERLVVNKKYNPYTYVPTSFKELRNVIEDMYDTFGPGTEQKPINFNDIDVSNIDSLCNKNKGIFEGTKFEYIDISDWNVSKVKDISFMFYECKQLKSVGDLSKWDVSGVNDMYGVFYNCQQLESIGDLSDWNVSNVENMWRMFYGSGIKNTPDWYKQYINK